MAVPTLRDISEMIAKVEMLKETETGREPDVPLDGPVTEEETVVEQLIRRGAGCDVNLSPEIELLLLAGRNPIRKTIPVLKTDSLRRLLRVIKEVLTVDKYKGERNGEPVFTKEGEWLYEIRESISYELQKKKSLDIDKIFHAYWDYLKQVGSWENDKQRNIKDAIISPTPSVLDGVIHELKKIEYKLKLEAKEGRAFGFREGAERIRRKRAESQTKPESDRQPTTLMSFIEIHCDLSAKPDIQSKVALLHEYNRKKKIKLPKLAHKYKKGQHKYYYVDDLKMNWAKYQKEMPTLPPLKAPGK